MPPSAKEFLGTSAPAQSPTWAERIKGWLTPTLTPEQRANAQRILHAMGAYSPETPKLPPEQWANEQAHNQSGAGREFVRGATFGYSRDMFTGGNNPYDRALSHAEERERAKYSAEHPIKATAANLAGNVASTLMGGRLLGLGGSAATKVVPALGKVGQVAGRGANLLKRAAPLAAKIGGGIGALTGGVSGEQIGGDKTITGRAEGALEGAAEGAVAMYTAAKRLPEAMVAAALGALQGSGEAGAGHRREGAIKGGIVSGVAGGVIPQVGRLGGELAQAADARLGYVGTKGLRALEDHARQVLGLNAKARLPVPVQRALERSVRVNESTHLPTHEELEAINHRRAALGHPPVTVADISSSSRKLTRATTLRHEGAQTQMEGNIAATRSRLAPELEEHAGRVAPHTDNTAEQEIERLKGERSLAASRDYAEPYAHPVQTDDRLMDVLHDPNVRTVIGDVRKTQEAWFHHDPQAARTLVELDHLDKYYEALDKMDEAEKAWKETGGWDLSKVPPANMPQVRNLIHDEQAGHYEFFGSPEEKASRDAARQAKNEKLAETYGAVKMPEPQMPEPPVISGGTLHRIQTQLRNTAEEMQGTSLNPSKYKGRGAGLAQTANEISEHLEQVPHLNEANAAFQAHSIRMQALDEGEHQLNQTSREFDAWLDGLTNKVKDPKARSAVRKQVLNDMRVSLRDWMTGKGKKPASAMAVLDDITHNIYLRRNIPKVLGTKEASDLFEYASIMQDQNRFAQSMSGRGSGTIADAESLQMLGRVSEVFSHKSALQFLLDWTNAGSRVTPEEATAINDFTLGDAHALIDAAEKHPEGFLAQALRVSLARYAGGAVQTAPEEPEAPTTADPWAGLDAAPAPDAQQPPAPAPDAQQPPAPAPSNDPWAGLDAKQ